MKYRIINKTDHRNRPKEYELSAAIILAKHYKTDITIFRPSCQRTPDFEIKGIRWELKSPMGNGKNTIKNALHSARKQSANVIIDLRRIKMYQPKALSNIQYYFASHRSIIKHLIIITKTKEVIEVF